LNVKKTQIMLGVHQKSLIKRLRPESYKFIFTFSQLNFHDFLLAQHQKKFNSTLREQFFKCVSFTHAHLIPIQSSRYLVLLAPHTSGPRDVPRFGALSLLQKTPHYRGDRAETAARLNVKSRVLVTGDW
jgi:hypothetical protein